MKKHVRIEAPYRLRPVIIPLGFEILHERERAQGEIFHPAYRKGDAFFVITCNRLPTAIT